MRRLHLFFTMIATEIVTLALFLSLCKGEDVKCVSREFGGGNVVCVCNATYCDTIESLPQLTNDKYWHVASDKAGLRFNKKIGSFNQAPEMDTLGTHSVTIGISLTHCKARQTIDGFGGAFTDAATINIMKLTEATRQHLMSSYFSTDGLEYTFGRVPIGGCDFSTRPYTYNDCQNNDFSLMQFNLTDEDYKYKIPMIKLAQQMSQRSIKLFASAWSAPAWMKNNNDLKGFGQLKGMPGGAYYQTWALYYLKFLEAYKSQGIEFWAVTAQNEPTAGYIPYYSFNCMGFTASSQRIFIESNLGPTLANNGFSGLDIIMLDDNRVNLPMWPLEVLKDSSNAKNYVKGIGVHWYFDDITPPDVFDTTHSLFPNKYILATEACEGAKIGTPDVILGSWMRAESYATDIIQDLSHWVVGWVDWNIALDMTGGPNWAKNYVDSPIIINHEADEFYKQPMFYALGHFSKFVRPGCVVIESSILIIEIAFLQPIAFDCPDDGSTVLVILNKYPFVKSVAIDDPKVGKLRTLLTASSINTFVYWPNN